MAWMLIAYLFLHIVAQLLLGGLRQLLKIFNPRVAYGNAILATLVIALLAGVGVYALDKVAIRDLVVVKTDTPPELDGQADDAVWQNVQVVDVVTTRGANQADGEVTVSIKMLRDEDSLYALFQWPDSTRSQKHLPLQKTAEGWRVVQKEFGIQDEDDYYEDKFAVMLARTPQLAGAGTTHLGPKPLAGKPAPSGGRGLHYTTDGSIVDVWHWKSVRTGSFGQIDDNYFGPPLEPSKKPRYTGGYTQDPKTGGGFKMNWEKFSDDTVQPLRLPKDPALLNRLGRLNLDPKASDDGEFWLPMAQTVAYSEDLDTYPVGTVMPSVLIEGPFEGDRGDVQVATHWQNGQWTMEVSRKLDTGSEYDVALTDKESVYLWVSVFDHAQTRHSVHLHPLRIVLQ